MILNQLFHSEPCAEQTPTLVYSMRLNSMCYFGCHWQGLDWPLTKRASVHEGRSRFLSSISSMDPAIGHKVVIIIDTALGVFEASG